MRFTTFKSPHIWQFFNMSFHQIRLYFSNDGEFLSPFLLIICPIIWYLHIIFCIRVLILRTLKKSVWSWSQNYCSRMIMRIDRKHYRRTTNFMVSIKIWLTDNYKMFFCPHSQDTCFRGDRSLNILKVAWFVNLLTALAQILIPHLRHKIYLAKIGRQVVHNRYVTVLGATEDPAIKITSNSLKQ